MKEFIIFSLYDIIYLIETIILNEKYLIMIFDWYLKRFLFHMMVLI
jgi:hypothetical protein